MITLARTATKYRSVSIDQLADVPLLRPKTAGRFWQGIPHSDLVTSLVGECKERGWKVTDTRLTVDRKGSELAGTIGLEIPTLAAPEGQRLQMGFLTSNAMNRALRLVVGSQVFICMNGMVTGEIVLRHKHTTGFSLDTALPPAFDRYMEKAKLVKEIVVGLQKTTLTDVDVDRLLCSAGRSLIMPWSRLGEVDKEYRHPSFNYGTERATSWGLLNAFTHVVKKNPPMMQMHQINAFRASLPTVAADVVLSGRN